MEIRNKVIAITGSGQGLGRQFAIDCALKGARLALLDLDYDKVKKVAGECIELGAEANYYKMDVTSENDVKECYEQIVKDFGSLHASINNAGILRDGLLIKEKNGEISTFPLRKWQEVIDTNLTGVFLCGREAAFNMVKLKIRGVIINISSLSYHGNLGQTNYSAAKAGVCSLTVLWAKELAKYGIRVVAIAPGFAATEMVNSLREDIKKNFANNIPLKRFAEPAEISSGIIFLLENDYVTGEILQISGGVRI